MPPPFSSAPADEALPLLAETTYGLINSWWATRAANDVSAIDAMAQRVYPGPRSRQYLRIPNTPTRGAIDDDPLPLQDCPVLVKKSAYGTRWGTGRVFVIGTTETDQAGGRLNPPYMTYLQTLGERYAENVVFPIEGYSLTFAPVLFGRLPDGSPRVTPIDMVVPINDILKTQRRRRPGKGI